MNYMMVLKNKLAADYQLLFFSFIYFLKNYLFILLYNIVLVKIRIMQYVLTQESFSIHGTQVSTTLEHRVLGLYIYLTSY